MTILGLNGIDYGKLAIKRMILKLTVKVIKLNNEPLRMVS